MVCAFLSTVTPLEMRALTVIIVTVIIVAKSRVARSDARLNASYLWKRRGSTTEVLQLRFYKRFYS